jgi:hypothetical protein
VLSTSRSAGAGQWPVAYPRRERVPKSQTGLAKDLRHLVAGRPSRFLFAVHFALKPCRAGGGGRWPPSTSACFYMCTYVEVLALLSPLHSGPACVSWALEALAPAPAPPPLSSGGAPAGIAAVSSQGVGQGAASASPLAAGCGAEAGAAGPTGAAREAAAATAVACRETTALPSASASDAEQVPATGTSCAAAVTSAGPVHWSLALRATIIPISS